MFLYNWSYIKKSGWNNNRIVYVNERNQNKNKIKSLHIQIYHAFYCSISAQTMQWYKSRMASLYDVRVKRKISCQCLTQHDVCSQLKYNLLKKNGCTEHPLTPHLRLIASHFCLTPQPPPPSRWTAYVYHPYYVSTVRSYQQQFFPENQLMEECQ